MRTILLFGIVVISEHLNYYSGYRLSSNMEVLLNCMFVFSVVVDTVYLFKKNGK